MKIGDKIIISEQSCIYSSYEDMANKMKLKNWVAGRGGFLKAPNNYVNLRDKTGIIKKILPHGIDPEYYGNCVGISLEDGYDYIFGEKALKVVGISYLKIPKEMFEL